MTSQYRGFLSGAGLALILGFVGGCASVGTQSQLPPEEIVRLRAQAWADDLRAADIEGAWAFTSPTYRQFSTADQYHFLVLGSARWTSAVVDSVKCAEDVCDVGIMVEYHIPRLKLSNRRVLEYKWVEAEGDWWLHVPSK
jgi:hypothetical protein